MKILFISKELMAGHVAYLLQKEGHDVRLYIEEKDSRNCFDNLIAKSENWKSDISWVGKDGLIVFDDTGYGKEQDKLRAEGYTVFGGSAKSEKLETNREFGQEVFKKNGLKTMPLKEFSNLDDAIVFAKENPKPWVIKRSGKTSKFLTYVSKFDDGRDSITLMKNYLNNKKTSKSKVALHERIDGVEMGVARYFNGSDWVGPIEFNVEHTFLLPGDIGPATSEMGTLAWYSDDFNNKLYKETLEPMTKHLRKTGFRGDFSLNCIVNETGAYILEATTRLGSPIVHLQSELHDSPWGEFMLAIARGESYDLKWKKGYGVVVLVAIPPFPYLSESSKGITPFGMDIHFKNMNEADWGHIHFDEIAKRRQTEHDQYFIADNKGYVLYVTGIGQSVQEAQKQVYDLTKKVIIPRMMYRNDIGQSFIDTNQQKLTEWGYL